MDLRILNPNEDKSNSLLASEECQQLLTVYQEYYPQVGFNSPWVAYLIVKEKQVVGTCSFVTQPIDGKVELAYWTFKNFEGQGIASFGCEELVKIAQKTDPSIIITAKTAPENNASTHILKQNQFLFKEIVQDKEIGDAWLWVFQAD